MSKPQSSQAAFSLADVFARASSVARERALVTLGSLPLEDIGVRRALVVFTSVPPTPAAPADPVRRRIRQLADGVPHCECVVAHPRGADPGTVRRWLGADVATESQDDGDLTDRLRRAMRARFDAGADRVVVVDPDRADVGAPTVEHAFAALRYSELVVGPTAGGDIYLLGLGHMHQELLAAVPWGTSGVLDASLRGARERRLSVTLLPELAAR